MENTSIDEYLLLKKSGFIMENTSVDEYPLWPHHGKHIN